MSSRRSWLLALALVAMAAPIAHVRAQTFLQVQRLRSDPAAQFANFGQGLQADGQRAIVLYRSGTPSGYDLQVFERGTSGFAATPKVTLAWPDLFVSQPAIAGDIAALGRPEASVDGKSQQGQVQTLVRGVSGWTVGPVLAASDGLRADRFGATIALDGTTLVVGAPGDDDAPTGSLSISIGSLYVYELVDGIWQARAKLVSPVQHGGSFGSEFALRGDRIVAKRFPLAGEKYGSFVVFERTLGVWAFSADIPIRSDLSGFAVGAIDLKEDRIRTNTFNIGSAEGTVVGFVRNGSAWTEEFAFSPTLRGEDFEIYGMSMTGGPDSLFLSARGPESGSVYVYRRVEGSWVYRQRLGSVEIGSTVNYGRTMASTGSTVLIGDTADQDMGSVFVFEDLPLDDGALLGDAIRNASGSSGDGAGDAIAFANGLLIVGAPDSDTVGSASGEVYVFELAPGAGRTSGPGGAPKRTSGVTLLGTLTSSGGGVGDKFGAAVAVSNDGSTIVVGSPGASGGNGRVEVFRRPPGGWSSMNLADDLVPSPTADTAVVPRAFGSAVAIDAEGVIAVGAPASDRPGAAGAGMAALYVPEIDGYKSEPSQVVLPNDAQAEAGFGEEVDIAGGVLTVAAPNLDRPGPLPDAGAVYTYERAGALPRYDAAQVLTPPNGSNIGDKFGRSVAIDPVPGIAPAIAIGASGIDEVTGQDVGSAFVFERGGASYTPVARLLTGGRPADRAGTSIEIYNGDVMLGAPEADREGEPNSGATYLFRRPSIGWTGSALAKGRAEGKGTPVMVSALPDAELPPSQVQPGQFFGSALALSSSAAYVSAPSRDVVVGNTVNQDQGEVDVFTFDAVFADSFE